MQHEDNATDQSEDEQNIPTVGGVPLVPLETDSEGNAYINYKGGKPNSGWLDDTPAGNLLRLRSSKGGKPDPGWGYHM